MLDARLPEGSGIDACRQIRSVDPSIRALILTLIADGLTNQQIAAEMFLAEKTAKNHVSSLLAKLGMERRTQAELLRELRRELKQLERAGA